jgi:outer membrane protein insertion porin family
MFGFTEPYLFDRPISSGFTLFSSQYKFDQAQQEALLYGQSVSLNPQYIQNYNQNSSGFTVFANYPMRRFSFTRVGLTYGLTRTDIKSFNQASTLLFESLQFQSLTGPSALNGIVSSTITPTITYNTVNNPINPTGGKSFFYSLAVSGLGGNVNTITNVFDMKYFHPVNKRRNVLGFHATVAHTTGYGGKEVPPFSRFYMGGENDLRGYDIRSISPVTFIPESVAQPISYRDSSCNCLRSFTVPVLEYVATLPGGDIQGYGNAEYRIPIVGPVTAGLFFDGGTTGVLKRSAMELNPAGFASLVDPTQGGQFPNAQKLAGLTQQLAIAPGTNFRLRGSTGIEFVVQLPIIQAPFRIYYAYDVNRLHEQLVAKQPYIEPNEIKFLCNEFGGGSGCNSNPIDPLASSQYNLEISPALQYIQNNPGRLNYFEPKTTFRFTVSRTF